LTIFPPSNPFDEHATAQLERLQIEDADIRFARNVALPESDQVLLRKLMDETPWREEKITVWGKTYQQPRLIAWYGDEGQRYAYSGISLEPLPWTKTLLNIREVVQEISNESFNSVLLNYYRDHRDSMGFHSDDERELGPTPAIVSVSLGATRTFVLKHKHRVDVKPVRIALPTGSLLIMKGQTQKNWKHGIDKQKKPSGPRVNLTFRRIYPI
jgi:alkylated DNA repair dioxygenase AlkB